MMKRLGIALAILLITGSVSLAQPPENCQGLGTNDLRTTDADDFLTGSDGADVAALGLGDDQYFAALGPDVICGNEGAEVIVGEEGADSITGGPGDDLVAGFGGSDFLSGGPGSDSVQGQGGDDELRAGVDEVRDDIYDGLGEDTIIGTAEDRWWRCDDGVTDPHDNFAGLILPDPDCSA